MSPEILKYVACSESIDFSISSSYPCTDLKVLNAAVKAFWLAKSALVSQSGPYLGPFDTDPYHTMMPL